jgi:hypothetical protein
MEGVDVEASGASSEDDAAGGSQDHNVEDCCWWVSRELVRPQSRVQRRFAFCRCGQWLNADEDMLSGLDDKMPALTKLTIGFDEKPLAL